MLPRLIFAPADALRPVEAFKVPVSMPPLLLMLTVDTPAVKLLAELNVEPESKVTAGPTNETVLLNVVEPEKACVPLIEVLPFKVDEAPPSTESEEPFPVIVSCAPPLKVNSVAEAEPASQVSSLLCNVTNPPMVQTIP
ncbi:MAG TPA: hypothetical protein VM760_02140 [Sphingomicrobium sp.]|nr:hypothetical protein [Sphingomicrobium sp.]